MENMTSKELKEMAKELKVKNWWTLKKTELIAEIQKIQNAQVESEEVNDENIVEESTEAPESTENNSQPAEKKSKRKEDLIEYNGKTQSLSAWAKELGMPGQTLYARLRISNWPVEKAFTTPSRRKNKDDEEA